MENRWIYFTNPANLVSLGIFLFTLWVTWSKVDTKVKDLERRVNKLEEADLETKLREIKIDLDWIKKELQKLSK